MSRTGLPGRDRGARLVYLRARLGHLQAVALRLQDTVGLYVALGGGWWSDPAVMGTD